MYYLIPCSSRWLPVSWPWQNRCGLSRNTVRPVHSVVLPAIAAVPTQEVWNIRLDLIPIVVLSAGLQSLFAGRCYQMALQCSVASGCHESRCNCCQLLLNSIACFLLLPDVMSRIATCLMPDAIRWHFNLCRPAIHNHLIHRPTRCTLQQCLSEVPNPFLFIDLVRT